MTASAAQGLGRLGLVRSTQRDKQPVVDLSVEDGEADAILGQDIAVGVREPADQAVEPPPPQIVSQLARGVSVAEQSGG